MHINDALERFLTKRRETMSVNTITGYRAAVKSLVEFGIERTRDLTRARVSDWIAKRLENDLAPATINTQLAAILSIASELERQELFPLQRLMGLRRLRLRAEPIAEPDYLSREDVARLRVAALAIDPQLDLAIAFAVFAGMRLHELRRLHAEDLVIGERETKPFIRVLRKRGEIKNKKSRLTPIAVAFAADLRRRELPPGPIFPQRHPNAASIYVGQGTLQDWFRKARDEAKLHTCTWFTLRHSFASHLRQHGVELGLVSGWMGNTVRICEAFYAAMGPGGNELVERGFADPPAKQPVGEVA